jgi:hypothetical protein
MNPLRSAYYLLAAFVLGAVVSGIYLSELMSRG